MDNKSYRVIKVETIDVDLDAYTENIIAYVEDKVYEDYDISYKDIEDYLLSSLMKDIAKKLIEKYVDKA